MLYVFFVLFVSLYKGTNFPQVGSFFCHLFFTNTHSMLIIRIATVHKNEYNAIKPKIEQNSFSVVLPKTQIIIIIFIQNNKTDKPIVINI